MSNDREEAYRERSRRLEEAWKAPVQATEVWGGLAAPLHQAIMAYHQTGDIEPLLAAVRLPGALASADPESMARLIELIHARRAPPLKAGGPGAYLKRWRNPKMVAALAARIRLDAWRAENRKADVPRSVREGIVDGIVEPMPAYVRLSERVQKKFKDTVHGLIDKSKGRRL
jgi:hypothetical protein